MVMKVVEYKGRAGATFEQTTTDTAAALTAANMEDASGNPATSCVIQPMDNTIKIALGGTTPVAGASAGVGYELQDGDFLTLEGAHACASALIISAVASNHARVQVTPYFGG